MENKIIFGVNVPTQGLYRLVQEKLFELGYKWSSCGTVLKNTAITKSLQLWSDGTISEIDKKNWSPITSLAAYNDPPLFNYITIEELFDNSEMYKYNPPDPVIIGGYTVTNITPVSFQVGSTRITWKEVDKILELRPK